MSETISVENFGPIFNLTAEVQPGVTVIRGPNGSGKSTFVAALSAIVNGDKVPANVREGATAGRIEGAGRVIKIGKRSTTLGECEVPGVEMANISKLIEPGVSSEAAATSARIKELARLKGVTVTAEDLLEQIGEGVLTEATLRAVAKTSDPVEAIRLLKKEIEEKAREFETATETLKGELKVLSAQVKPLGEPVDKLAANEELRTAILSQNALIERQRLAEESAKKTEEARATLAAIASHDGDTLEDEFEQAQAEYSRVAREHEALQNKLRQLQLRMSNLEDRIAERDEKRREAARLKQIIESAAIAAPTKAELVVAEVSVKHAQERVATADAQVMCRDYQERAEAAQKKMTETMEKASRLRSASQGLEAILTKKIGGKRFSFRDGEIWWNGDSNRKPEPYANLSPGFRARIALEEAAEVYAGKLAILPLDQTYWESLDPTNRLIVAAAAEEYGLSIVTAEATGGELRSEFFKG